MDLELGTVITKETEQLYEELVNTPAQSIEKIEASYKKELDNFCSKYHVKTYKELIDLADSRQVDISDMSTIFDYSSFLQRHNLFN